ncbi:MAG TPA: redox-sensing transcriptional repressor Rex [Victivallales bacterium]|nr:redox-sensing transcriptional repressor Rex [Victivallales bacterium]
MELSMHKYVQKNKIPPRTMERLSMYRRILSELEDKGLHFIYSHQLAELASNTSAQVRRDLMEVNCIGVPKKGYKVSELKEKINLALKDSEEIRIALIGIGNLGRALLSYFNLRNKRLKIIAAFDSDPEKTGRVISGCKTYHINDLKEIVQNNKISIGIITVGADSAQEVADKLVDAGICGILNFAPVPLKVPKTVHNERIDITTSLEKVAYFAGLNKEIK